MFVKKCSVSSHAHTHLTTNEEFYDGSLDSGLKTFTIQYNKIYKVPRKDLHT